MTLLLVLYYYLFPPIIYNSFTTFIPSKATTPLVLTLTVTALVENSGLWQIIADSIRQVLDSSGYVIEDHINLRAALPFFPFPFSSFGSLFIDNPFVQAYIYPFYYAHALID